MKDFKLHDSLIFKGVDEGYIDDLLLSAEMIQLNKGEFLFHQNETGDAMYIIESGELQILLEQNVSGTNTQVVETLKAGALIGELCVFGHQKRSASIFANMDSNLIKIEGEDFRARLYSKELDALLICYNIAKLLSDRLSATNARLFYRP